MSDNESIFPNQSISQINFDEHSHTDMSHTLSENISTSDKLKSISAYLIVQEDPACLLELQKYFDKASVIFIFNVWY